jgi:hypothetical protein
MDNKRLGAVLLSYSVAYLLCTLVINYVLNFPAWLTEAPDLVKEFYIKNGVRFFVIEWFVVAAYLCVGHLVASRLNAAYGGAMSNCRKLLVVLAVVCALSAAFWLLFTRLPALRGTMYERWFSRAGYKALVFDAVYLGAIYVVFHKILSKFKYHNLL